MIRFVQKHIQGLIFDCDGTLADTLQVHIGAWKNILRETTLGSVPEISEASFWDDYNGVPTENILADIANRFSLSLDVRTLAAEKEEQAFSALNEIQPIDEVIAVAKHFHGRLPLAVVSGGVRKNVLRTLEVLKITDLFQVILSADDGLKGKPAPDLFLYAAGYLRVPPGRCMVFEDGEAGLEGARKAGMLAFDVRPHLKGLLD